MQAGGDVYDVEPCPLAKCLSRGVCPSLKGNEGVWWGQGKALPSFSRASAFIKNITKVE